MVSRRHTINAVNQSMYGLAKPGISRGVWIWAWRVVKGWAICGFIVWLLAAVMGVRLGYALLVATMAWLVMGAVWLD